MLYRLSYAPDGGRVYHPVTGALGQDGDVCELDSSANGCERAQMGIRCRLRSRGGTRTVSSGEYELVRWLTARFGAHAAHSVSVGVGDDMAIIDRADRPLLQASDMLLDGVHFDLKTHSLEAVGHKAMACSLSDCAAMAARPVAAVVSLALPAGWTLEASKRLFEGMAAPAEAYDCPIVGGDTTSWDQRLAIDVAITAEPYPGCRPILRSGARVGDILMVTGTLGGSLAGKHLNFQPRVREAKRIVESHGQHVHAMMDISDGLSLDLHRLCEASRVGAILDERLLDLVTSDAAREMSNRDGHTPIDHVLSDGEDFELLLAVDPSLTDVPIANVKLARVGVITESRLQIRTTDGQLETLEPRGFEHLQ
jgi:thiamine-monophosphate kinase